MKHGRVKKISLNLRLLCKMDTSKSRPKVFIDNNICILSIKMEHML